ncbi:hypothetical protein ABLW26_23675, partial [Salmonella enterica]|uniref:hypothetical protein n=1 Tax=Salmonella enterica TaxID=28901 RepID=UPI0032B488C1
KDAAPKLAAQSHRPSGAKGIALTPLARTFEDAAVVYSTVRVDIDRAARRATILIQGPTAPPPADAAGIESQGDQFWS